MEELADRASLHSTSISRIETGKQEPGWETVSALAAALDIEIADLARLAAKQPRRAAT